MDLIKRNCDECKNEYTHSSRQKSKYCSGKCKSNACNKRKKQMKFKNAIENKNYVICKICNEKFSEINNTHLKLHNTTTKEYDINYQDSIRISEDALNKKDVYTNKLTTEMSLKLKKSHTLEGLIEKHGEILGTIKYNKWKINTSRANSIDYYIDKFGQIKGEIMFKDIQSKKKITLNNLIIKYGKENGTIKYNEWKRKQKVKNTLSYYVELYGNKGLDKWLNKNNSISLSNSKISIKDKTDFEKYIKDVNSFTRISLSINTLKNIELRGKIYNFDLDHIISKVDGFKNNIPSYILGHISNLRIIPASQNRIKQHKSDLKLETIIENFNKDIEYRSLIQK